MPNFPKYCTWSFDWLLTFPKTLIYRESVVLINTFSHFYSEKKTSHSYWRFWWALEVRKVIAFREKCSRNVWVVFQTITHSFLWGLAGLQSHKWKHHFFFLLRSLGREHHAPVQQRPIGKAWDARDPSAACVQCLPTPCSRSGCVLPDGHLHNFPLRGIPPP